MIQIFFFNCLQLSRHCSRSSHTRWTFCSQQIYDLHHNLRPRQAQVNLFFLVFCFHAIKKKNHSFGLSTRVENGFASFSRRSLPQNVRQNIPPAVHITTSEQFNEPFVLAKPTLFRRLSFCSVAGSTKVRPQNDQFNPYHPLKIVCVRITYN